MSKFKAGDRMKLIDAAGYNDLWQRWIGKEFSVEDVRPNEVKILSAWHPDERFELVTPAPTEAPEPRYMTLGDFETAVEEADAESKRAQNHRQAANLKADAAAKVQNDASLVSSAAFILIHRGYRILPPEQTP